MFADERSPVGAAEQEQRLGEVDRPCVDGVESIEELVVVAIRIVARDVEQGLRDRQRGAQFVRGVGGESLLLGDVCFEAREHRVEAVGELAELVAASLQWMRWESDPFAATRVASVMRVRGASMRPARSQPPSEPEHQQEPHHDGRDRSEIAQEVGVAAHHEDHTGMHTTRQRHVPDDEQHGAREHEEAGIAEGELEPNAQPRASIHARLPRASMR